MATCLRCGANARVTSHQIQLDATETWSADLCPRHYMQVLDFLEMSLNGWSRKAAITPPTAAEGLVLLDAPRDAKTPEPAVKKRRGANKLQGTPKTKKRTVEATAPISRGPAADVNPAEVRAWANAQGIEVSKRGRISQTVIDAYLRDGGTPPPVPKEESVKIGGMPKPRHSAKSARNKTALDDLIFSNA